MAVQFYGRKGTKLFMPSDPHLFFELSNMNARLFLRFLKIGAIDLLGEREVSTMKRVVAQAKEMFTLRAPGFVRRTEQFDNALIRGCSVEDLRSYLDRFSDFVDQVAIEGATHVSWS